MPKAAPKYLCALLAVSILVAGCDIFNSGVKGKIVKKVVGPNGTVTALITREGGNATVAYTFRVYLQQAKFPGSSMVIEVYKISELKLLWKDQNNLIISLQCGQVYSYNNFYDVAHYKTGILIRRITVTLEPTKPCSEKVLTSPHSPLGR